MNRDVFARARIRRHANVHAAGAVGYPAVLRRRFNLKASAEAAREISAWPGYQPTALVSLAGVASKFGLSTIHYKDESSRFGLGSFKALGGAYAVQRLLARLLHRHGHAPAGEPTAADLEGGAFAQHTAAITVVTATDGNHGRSVAWGAARFGCRCRIYIHAGVSERRAQAMQELGAQVIRVSGNYDESVRAAAAEARQNQWHVVSDTSYPGYTDLPAQVMAGYSVMMAEIMAQLPPGARFTHVFAQGGVGGLAAAVATYLWEKLGAERPRFIVVEPELADCLFQSAVRNRPTEVRIVDETIMAGLSCGEVSTLAWQALSTAADDFITIGDALVGPTMRLLARRPGIEAGESAVAGLACCLAACAQPRLKAELGLNEHSQVLVLGTEGATDRQIYDEIMQEEDDSSAG